MGGGRVKGVWWWGRGGRDLGWGLVRVKGWEWWESRSGQGLGRVKGWG